MKNLLLLFILIVLTATVVQARQGCTIPNFASPTNSIVGDSPGAIVTSDFNNDGKLDLAIANAASANISILLGNGIGSFAPTLTFNANGSPNSIAAGDFNSDGSLDLAVAGGTFHSVVVLIGDGTGSFAAPVNYATYNPYYPNDYPHDVTGLFPQSIVVADFNFDGMLDIATASRNTQAPSITYLYGNGNGTFREPFNAHIYPVFYISAGDFNSDGRLELVSVHRQGLTPGFIAIPQANNSYQIGIEPQSPVTADFNADGKLDVVVPNSGSDNVSILRGDGSFGFSLTTNISVGARPSSVAVDDLNSDGKLDLVTTNANSNDLSILLGDGLGNFAPAFSIALNARPSIVKTGDFNGDGKADIVIANAADDNVSVLLNTCNSNPTTFIVTRSDDRNETCISGVDCSLREAINAANAAPSDDVINFASGITKISLSSQTNTPVLVQTFIAIENAGTLTINGLGANVFAIDVPGGGSPSGDRQYRIFRINGATVTINDVTLTGSGSTQRGSVIDAFGGTVILDRVHIKGNKIIESTGAVVEFSGGTNHQILNSTFSGNSSNGCPALRNSGTLTITNSTITNNTALYAGGTGGGFCNSGTATLRNVTITGNSARERGAGIDNTGGTLNLGNTIIAGNTNVDNSYVSCRVYGERCFTEVSGGSITTTGYNIIGNADVAAIFPSGSPNSNNDFVGTIAAPFNPQLGPLQNNGGPTPTHAFLPNNPAINAGNNANVIDSTDQRGFERIVGGIVDIGAVESETIENCSLTMYPANQSFTGFIGTGTINFTITTGCGWTAQSNAAWITITSRASGTNSGTVQFTVAANTGAARTGTITVGGQTFTVNQAAPCSYSLSSANMTIPKFGGVETVNIITETRCAAWTALSNVPWITVLGNGNNGDGSFSFSVRPNNGPSRTGTITIADKTFTVTQQDGCVFTLSSFGTSFPASGGTGSFNITSSNVACSWSASPSASWITINGAASGTGNGTVTFTLQQNIGLVRLAAITVNDRVFTINQTAASYSVFGTVTYGIIPENQPPSFVSEVNLNATGLPLLSAISNASGVYQLFGLTAGGDYTVTPSKSGDIKGINSLDATRIQQHLVGLITLTPNQLIAADTDGNGTVNSLDATRIQQRLVGITAQNIIGQWKFVPGSKQYNSVSNNAAGENYEAVLVGEVSGNWASAASFADDSQEELLPKQDNQSNAIERFEQELAEAIAGRMKHSADSQSNESKSESAVAGLPPVNVSLPANASATNSSSITIPVTIGAVPAGSPIESFDFTVFYDPAVLQPASPAGSNAGTLSANCSVLANSPQSGRVVVSGACATAITTSSGGVLYNLQFNVIGTSGQQTGLLFNNPSTGTQTFQFNSGNPSANTMNGSFSVLPGPTAASVTVSGRAVTAQGRGIRNVLITLTDANGNERTAQTTTFGYYRFESVAVGETVTISAKARRFRFNQSSIVRTTNESITNADFVSEQ